MKVNIRCVYEELHRTELQYTRNYQDMPRVSLAIPDHQVSSEVFSHTWIYEHNFLRNLQRDCIRNRGNREFAHKHDSDLERAFASEQPNRRGEDKVDTSTS